MTQAAGLQFEKLVPCTELIEFLQRKRTFCENVRTTAIRSRENRLVEQMNKEANYYDQLIGIVLERK